MILTEIASEFTIYVDADGVLVDFDKRVRDIGFDPKTIGSDKKEKNRFWAKVGSMAKKGQPFWGNMDKMSDADELMAYLAKYKPEILTATGHVGNAGDEKREWFGREYGDIKVHLVKKSSDKATFAGPKAVLIDDRSKSIDPWVEAGGVGILHTSAADTIEQLKKLGL